MATGDASIREEGARERSRLVARAGVVGAGTRVSRVLGLLRDMVLAAVFDRDATDAWWVAFTIPNALRQLLGEGAVASAVVPVLSDKLAKEGDEAARVFFARVRGVSLIALVVVTALGVAFAGPLTALFANGYRGRPGELERTTTLTRVVFPYIFFMGSAALGMAALNAKRHFAVAAFAPGLLNVALLAAALGLPGVLVAGGHDPVLALAFGALVGGLLQLVAQWPALRAIGYAGGPQLALDPDVRKVFRRLGPLALGVGVYYVDLVLSRRFLSDLGAGAQSYFSWAMRLCDFPQGIFVMALSTAALPSLSTLAARGDRTELAKTWAHGMCLALFVALPASAALLALGEPIVVALFQRGAFDAHAAHETARALFWQGGAIWTVAAVRQTVPAFYALGDTRSPVIVSAVDLTAFIALAVGLKGPMGHVGISVAVAGSSAVQMTLLLVGLRWRMGTLEGAALARSAARTVAASAVAAVAGWGIARLLTPAGPVGGVARALPGLVGLAGFMAAFGAVAWGMRSPELEEISSTVRRRLGRTGRARGGQ
jgi:putative peptidoglycan lipid II flippase